MTTLDLIRDEDGTFPVRVLEGARTALVLFAAAFLGRNDAAWIADAGLIATCVDRDRDRLGLMGTVYPASWRFVTDDVFEFVDAARAAGEQWDVVTADPWTNHFARVAALDLVSLARRAVILGTGPTTPVAPRHGWEVTEIAHRSDHAGGVYWTVMEPR